MRLQIVLKYEKILPGYLEAISEPPDLTALPLFRCLQYSGTSGTRIGIPAGENKKAPEGSGAWIRYLQ